MNQQRESHRKAMILAQNAFLLLEENPEKALSLFRESFDIEKSIALSYIDNTDNITSTVLLRSAASLAKLSKYDNEVLELAKKGLTLSPPKAVFRELLSLVINKYQQDFCFSENQNIRLLAPAGSGKTTSLLWRCLDFLTVKDSKARFLIFTFTKVARDELRDRIDTNPELKPLKNNVRIETLNQWGFNYIKSIKEGLQLKTSKQDQFYLINNNLRRIWENKPFLGKLTNKRNIYSDIIEVFSEIKTLGFDHSSDNSKFFQAFSEHFQWLISNGLELYFIEKIYNPVKDWELLDFSKFDLLEQLTPFLLFWKNSCDELWGQSLITLEDQKYWALRVLSEQYPNDKTFPTPQRYNHILIDEFQDINPLDLQLIKKLSELNKSTLSIVGDDDQAIFEWRGSSPKFILKPENYFPREFELIILNINYRSPKNIIELSQRLIKNNVNRVDKKIEPNSKDVAEIQIIKQTNHIACIPYIIDFAKDLLKDKTEKLAIISRKKGQLVPLQIMFTSENIPFYAKEDLNILLSNAFNDLKKILVIAATKKDRRASDAITSDIITCCNQVGRFPLKKAEVKPLYSFIISQKPKTFLEALGLLNNYPNNIKSHPSFYYSEAITSVINHANVSSTIVAIGENFDGLKKHYVKSDDDIFYKDPPFLYLSEYAERYGSNYWDFIDHVELAISKMSNQFDENQEEVDIEFKNQIHLMTALRAKGKEFENVMILDVNEGVWPIKYAETVEQLEQERRLFYVAITRTKKRLFLFTVDEIHTKSVSVSPYIEEMGL
jgi:DNA helicase II / ATP-dependent DNA helicase PcrA